MISNGSLCLASASAMSFCNYASGMSRYVLVWAAVIRTDSLAILESFILWKLLSLSDTFAACFSTHPLCADALQWPPLSWCGVRCWCIAHRWYLCAWQSILGYSSFGMLLLSHCRWTYILLELHTDLSSWWLQMNHHLWICGCLYHGLYQPFLFLFLFLCHWL